MDFTYVPPMPRPHRAPEPEPLHRRAAEDLSFIRATMARATPLTAVPGWGGVAMGVSALVAAWFASRQDDPAEWLAVWLAEAVLALGIGGFALVRKAFRSESPGTVPRGQAVRGQLRAAAARGRAPDAGALSRRPVGTPPGRLAAAVRHRGHHRGRLLDPGRPDHGRLPHGGRRGGPDRRARRPAISSWRSGSAWCRSDSDCSSQGGTVADRGAARRVARPKTVGGAAGAAGHERRSGRVVPRARPPHSRADAARHRERARGGPVPHVRGAQADPRRDRRQSQRPRAEARGCGLRHGGEVVRRAGAANRIHSSPRPGAARSSATSSTWKT